MNKAQRKRISQTMKRLAREGRHPSQKRQRKVPMPASLPIAVEHFTASEARQILHPEPANDFAKFIVACWKELNRG